MACICFVKDNDTTWVEVEPPMFDRDGDLRPMQYVASYEWEPGATYKLEIDSLAAMGVYKQGNAPFSQTFSVRKESDYSTITFNVAGLDSVLSDGGVAVVGRQAVAATSRGGWQGSV